MSSAQNPSFVWDFKFLAQCICMGTGSLFVCSFNRPHHPVMAARDFNRRQTIFMSFRVILSNTTSLSSFPCEDLRVQGSANARRMPAMIAHLTWMIYLGQSRAHAHHALQPRIMKLVKMLSRLQCNTLIAPCINEYWLPSVVVMKGACQSRA